jgi:hypothetical protein
MGMGQRLVVPLQPAVAGDPLAAFGEWAHEGFREKDLSCIMEVS